jgi:hypothetical protein
VNRELAAIARDNRRQCELHSLPPALLALQLRKLPLSPLRGRAMRNDSPESTSSAPADTAQAKTIRPDPNPLVVACSAPIR